MFIVMLSVIHLMTQKVQSFGSEHEKIVNWWQKISHQTPLMKCHLNSSYLKSLHPLARNLTSSRRSTIRVINSRSCSIQDLGKKIMIYHFHGKTVNNKFEGPGKLRILRQASYVHDENVIETCLFVTKLPFVEQEIKEVVGTFVAGTLHDTAKLVLEDQTIVIADFNNGTLHGETHNSWMKAFLSLMSLSISLQGSFAFGILNKF